MGKQGVNQLVLFHKDCCDVSMIKSENKEEKYIHAAIKLNLLKEEEKNKTIVALYGNYEEK